ncbi:MAG: hypothetical protein ACK40L_19500, partial [Hydrogenophaga sp.]
MAHTNAPREAHTTPTTLHQHRAAQHQWHHQQHATSKSWPPCHVARSESAHDHHRAEPAPRCA